MSSTSVSEKLHPEFYFDDSLVVIKVEDTLFRVHKYQLNKSETFSNMFKMPQVPSNESEEGASRERPIVLEGVKASDFAALLKMLYASQYSKKGLESGTDIILPAFRLAHMWDFSDLRDYLLPLVKDALGCVDRIILARELGLQEWLAPAYVELCQREELPTRDEATKLGIDSLLMLSRLREQFRPPQSTPRSEHTEDCCDSCRGFVQRHMPYFGACIQCGNHFSSYHVLSGAGVAPSGIKVELEDQVKKWIEGGCVTE